MTPCHFSCHSMPLLVWLYAALPVTLDSSSCDSRPLLLWLNWFQWWLFGFDILLITIIDLQPKEKLPGVTGGAAQEEPSESQEERLGVVRGVAWSCRRSSMVSQEESCGDPTAIANVCKKMQMTTFLCIDAIDNFCLHCRNWDLFKTQLYDCVSPFLYFL